MDKHPDSPPYSKYNHMGSMVALKKKLASLKTMAFEAVIEWQWSWIEHLVSLGKEQCWIHFMALEDLTQDMLEEASGDFVFGRSVVSDSLRPQTRQGPSLSPGICSNWCPLNRWCHPTVPSSVVPFSSCLQSFAASGSFPMSRFFSSGGQSTEALAS